MSLRFLVFILGLGLVLSKPVQELEAKDEGLHIVCPKNGMPCYARGYESFGLINEGDILKAIEEAIDELKDEERNALIDKQRRWFGGVVPYIYHEEFSEENKARIEAAMAIIEEKTCIKFRPYRKTDREQAVVFITGQKGCRATVGFKQSRKRHNLNLHPSGCLRKVGTIMHEMLHVLGLKHEHARPDRDNYVKVIWDNIKEGHRNNFEKASAKEYTTYGVPYNFESVMHYPATSFSKNGDPTILPLDKSVDIKLLGQRKKITEHDLKKINIMYNCKKFL
uniref:Metalloendopeptidase n=1 Tax=Pristhesancus plagipennis TaxID=1955184 RepID=A0A1Q1NP87_PRIPG|nr:venom astacin-like protein 1 [Pristhesancus plagipennis]